MSNRDHSVLWEWDTGESLPPPIPGGNVLQDAFSPTIGLLAVPHSGRDVRIYAIDGKSASSSQVATLCQPPLEPPQATADVLGVAWGPSTICPQNIAVAYRLNGGHQLPTGYIALWTVGPPTVQTSPIINATYCSSFALSRKPRGLQWHPCSPLCLLMVWDVKEVSLYTVSSPTAPALLWRLPTSGSGALATCVWDPAGLYLVMATGGDVSLLVWASVGAVAEGPCSHNSGSTLLLGQELRAAQDDVLKTGLSMVRTALFRCAGALLVTTEASVDISSRSEGHQPMNSTLRELISVRDMKSPSTAPAEETPDDVTDLVRCRGGSTEGSYTAGLSALLDIRSITQQHEQPGPTGVASTTIVGGCGTLLALRILSEDPDRRRLAMDSGEVYRIQGMRVPSLLAYSKGQDGVALIALASEASNLIICLKQSVADGHKGSPEANFTDFCRFRLPPGATARGLVLVAHSRLLCYAVKRQERQVTAGHNSAPPLGILGTRDHEDVFSTRVYCFELPTTSVTTPLTAARDRESVDDGGLERLIRKLFSEFQTELSLSIRSLENRIAALENRIAALPSGAS